MKKKKRIVYTLRSEAGDKMSDPAEICKRASSLHTCKYKEDKATEQYFFKGAS